MKTTFEKLIGTGKRFSFHAMLGITAVFTFSLAAVALAQEVAEPLQDLDVAKLLSDVMGIVSQWKAGGALAGCIALVHVLVSLTKLKPLDPFFSKKAWIRPALSLFLGAALTFLTSLTTGGTLGAALLAGLLAGVGSMGFHELLNLFNKEKQAERAVGAAMTKLAKSDALTDSKAAALADQLKGIGGLPQSEKLAALAAFAKAHPPS